MRSHSVVIRRPTFNRPWGMNLRKDDLGRGTVIQSIQPTSPVISSDVQPNDIITTIDSVDTTKLPIDHVQLLFARSTELHLHIITLRPPVSSQPVAQRTTQPLLTQSSDQLTFDDLMSNTAAMATYNSAAVEANTPTPTAVAPFVAPAAPTTAAVAPPVNSSSTITNTNTTSQHAQPTPPAGPMVIDLISDDEDEHRPHTSSHGDATRESHLSDSDRMMSYDEDEEEDDYGDDDTFHHLLGHFAGNRTMSGFPPAPPRSLSATNRNNNSYVIDLISDDDEPPPPPPPPLPSVRRVPSVPHSAARVAPAATPVPASSTAAAAAPASSTAAAANTSGQRIRMMGKIKVKLEFEPKNFGEADIEDEVVEVEDPNKAHEENKKRSRAEAFADDGDEADIEIIGDNMITAADMPHQREACTKFSFNYYYGKNPLSNEKYCPNCYCYICEVKASDCVDWKQHCCANYKEAKWKKLRDSTNTPIMKLMTPSQKTTFLAKYAKLLAADNQQQQHGLFHGDSDDDDDDYNGHYGYNGYGHPPGFGNPNSTRVINEGIEAVKGILHRSDSIATADEYMECSALLVQMIGTKTSFKYDILHGLIIEWILHPLCRNDVKDVMKKELLKTAMNIHMNITKLIDFLPGFLANPNSYRDRLPVELFSLSEHTIAALIIRIAQIADFSLLQNIVNSTKGPPSSRGKIFYTLAQCNTAACDTILMKYLSPNNEEAFVTAAINTVPAATVLKVLCMMLDFNNHAQQSSSVGINTNTFLSMLQRVFRKINTHPAAVWIPIIQHIRENRFLATYLQQPGAYFHSWVSTEVLNNALDEDLRTKHLLELSLAIFIIQVHNIQQEVKTGVLQVHQVEKFKRMLPLDTPTISWVCANACVTFAYHNPNAAEAQHDRYLQAAIIFLKVFLEHDSDDSWTLYQQLHTSLQVELQRLPRFSTPPPSIEDVSPTIQVEYLLARHAGTNREQPLHETLQYASKDAVMQYLYGHDITNTGISGVEEIRRKFRHRIIGEYVGYASLVAILTVIERLWKTTSTLSLTAEDTEDVIRQKQREQVSKFFRDHLLLFRIAWKGLYFTLREDTYTDTPYSMVRSEFLHFIEKYKWPFEWTQSTLTPNTADFNNQVFQLVFSHHISTIAQSNLMENFAVKFMDTASKLKQDVMALMPYLQPGNAMQTAQFWYLGDHDSLCADNEKFFWREWKKPIVIISNVKSRVEHEQMLMGLMLEDWGLFEKALLHCHDPATRLSKLSYDSLQWQTLPPGEEERNVKKIAEILERFLKKMPAPVEFRTYPDQNVFSKLVLANPASILARASQSLSSDFLNLHVNSPIPIIHVLAAKYRNSIKYSERAVYVKAVEFVKKAAKMTYPSWAKYCVFQCGAFLGRPELLVEIVHNDFDLTVQKNYEFQQQGIYEFFQQVFLNVDETLLGTNIKAFLMPLMRMYRDQQAVLPMKDVIARVASLVQKHQDAAEVAVLSQSSVSNGSQHISSSQPSVGSPSEPLMERGLSPADDQLFFHMLLFFHYNNDESFSKLWAMIQDNQPAQKIITDFMQQIASTNRYVVSHHLKILFIMLGIDGFINFLPSIQIEMASLPKMVEMLSTILLLLPRITSRVDEVLVFVAKGIMRLQQLPEGMQQLIVQNIDIQVMLGHSADVVDMADQQAVTIPVADAAEYHQADVSRGFAMIFFLAIKYPQHIRAYLHQLHSFDFFQTHKLQIFQLLTNPKDTRNSLLLLAENRIFQAIPSFLMNQIDRSNPTRTEITALADCIRSLTTVIKPELLVEMHQPVTMETMLHHWQQPGSLLRTLFPCMLLIQSQYFAVKDAKQQHPNSNALRSAVYDLVRVIVDILQAVGGEKSLLSLYASCMSDFYHHMKEFVQTFVESDIGKAAIANRTAAKEVGEAGGWCAVMTEMFTCDLHGSNFYALLKMSRSLVELKKRRMLDYVVEIFGNDVAFHQHMLKLYTTPCSVWIGSHHQEKQVEGGIVHASRTLPSINESIIKYLGETITKLGRTAAKTFEVITIMMLLGYNPLDADAAQHARRAKEAPPSQAVTSTWIDFAKLVNTTLESKSLIMRSTIMLLESTTSPSLIQTVIKDIPSFRTDPAFPLWSIFFMDTVQNKIRLSLNNTLRLFIFHASFNPPLFPVAQMESLVEASASMGLDYSNSNNLDIAEPSALQLLNYPKILDILFTPRTDIGGDGMELALFQNRAKLLEILCKHKPDAQMAKRVGKLIEMVGNYARTQSMIAHRKGLVQMAVDSLRKFTPLFTGDEKVYLMAQKTMVAKWLKSKKPVMEIIMTL